MEFVKKIILVILVNILFAAMSIYLYNYLVIEYDNYVLENIIILDVLGADEASMIHGGGDIDDLTSRLKTVKGSILGS
jgi:hypothetical protein